MNIAVTGGMGAGKSFVAGELVEMLCADSVSADFLCRELLEPGQAGYEQMRKEFSSDFFLDGGSLNRSFLRKAIFTDELLREKINNILHPLVRKDLLHRCKSAIKQGVNLVVEVPLLFEKGWQEDFDTTLVVYADDETCLKRIVARDLVSIEDAQEAITCQMPLFEKCKLADWVIDNSGSFAETHTKLEQFTQKISTDTLFMRKCKKH